MLLYFLQFLLPGWCCGLLVSTVELEGCVSSVHVCMWNLGDFAPIDSQLNPDTTAFQMPFSRNCHLAVIDDLHAFALLKRSFMSTFNALNDIYLY